MRKTIAAALGLALWAASPAPGAAQTQGGNTCQSYIEQVRAALAAPVAGEPDRVASVQDQTKMPVRLTDEEREQTRKLVEEAQALADRGEETQCVAKVQQANGAIFVK